MEFTFNSLSNLINFLELGVHHVVGVRNGQIEHLRITPILPEEILVGVKKAYG